MQPLTLDNVMIIRPTASPVKLRCLGLYSKLTKHRAALSAMAGLIFNKDRTYGLL